MTRRSALLLAMVLAGCQHTGTAPAGKATTSRGVQQTVTTPAIPISAGNRIAPEDRADRGVVGLDTDIVIQLDVYELTIPFGRISRNPEFWKRVDEDHVDVPCHDLLLKNGLRFGVGRTSEWAYFKSLIDEYCPKAQRSSVAATASGSIELPMRKNVDLQDLFYLDDHGVLRGRTYEKCDNLLSIAFEPIPHRPGDARVKVCALVRSLRKHFEVTELNHAREIALIRPEYLYDLKLDAEVPMDRFLIVGPAPDARIPENVGNAFLVHDAGGEQIESVLVIVPRPFRLAPEVTSPRPVTGQAAAFLRK